MTRADIFARLGLGTAQFGQAYGVSNARGRVPVEEVAAILRRCAQAGMRTLDTAPGYGDAETVLGSCVGLTAPFRIVTKTILLRDGLDAVLNRARRSVEILRRRPVDFLLVHAARDLASPEGDRLWRELRALRDEGLFRGLGISAYAAEDPVALAQRYRPDAMQIPLSLIDQRLVHNGALGALKDLGVEIHARSIFLQGLLFMAEEKLPPKLRGAAPQLHAIRERIDEAGSTPLAVALAFALGRPEVDVALVGVTVDSELEEILDAAARPAPAIDWAACAMDDEMVLTPSLW